MSLLKLSHETRTFARMIQSLIEEAETINWYEQHISLERDSNAKAIMENAPKEELKHFCINLLFIKKNRLKTMVQNNIGKPGDIVKNGEKGEDKID